MISSPLVYTFSHNGGYTPSEITVPEFVQDLSPGLHPGRLTFRSPAVRLTFRSPAVSMLPAVNLSVPSMYNA